MNLNESVDFLEWYEAVKPILEGLAEAVAEPVRPTTTEASGIYIWPKIAGTPLMSASPNEHPPSSPVEAEMGKSA